MLGHRLRPLLAALVCALLQLSCPRLTRADSEPQARAEPAAVRVLLAGAEPNVAALQTALLDPFRRARIELHFEHLLAIQPSQLLAPPAIEDVSAAALAFDLSRPDRATLYVTDRKRTRIFVRQLEIDGSFDEVALERLVIAARSSVEAILAGESIGVPRTDYERSLRPPAPSQASPPPSHQQAKGQSVSLASRYEAEWLSGGVPSHGPGLMVLLDRGEVAFGASLGGRLPWRFTRGDIGLRLVTFNVTLTAELQRDLPGGWLVSGGLGLGLDMTLIQPFVLRAGAANVTRPSWALDPLGRAQFGVAHAWTSFWIGAFAGGDLAWLRARYTIERDGERETLLTPSVLRPFSAIAFGTTW